MIAWPLLIFAYGTLMVLGFIDNSRGPYFPEILIDLKLSDSQGSLFFAVTSILIFVSGLMAQKIAAKLKSLGTLRIGLLAFAAGVFAVSQAQNIYSLLAACAVLGIGFGIVSVAQNIAVFEASPEKFRRQLFAGLHSTYGLAALLAPFLISFGLAQGIHWRTGFQWIAILPVSLWALSFLVAKPSSHQRPAVDLSKLTPDERRFVHVLSLVLSCYLLGEVSLSTRLVLYLQRDLQFTDVLATQYMAGFFAFFLIGRLVFAVISFAHISNKQILFYSSTLTGALSVLGLVHNPLWLVFSGLTMAPFFPVLMEYVSSQLGPRTGQGIARLVGVSSLSVVVMHYGFGVISEDFGVRAALTVAPVGLLLSSGLLWITRKPQRNRKISENECPT